LSAREAIPFVLNHFLAARNRFQGKDTPVVNWRPPNTKPEWRGDRVVATSHL
jgi:hypothetical protein